jgi:hypothetical protein
MKNNDPVDVLFKIIRSLDRAEEALENFQPVLYSYEFSNQEINTVFSILQQTRESKDKIQKLIRSLDISKIEELDNGNQSNSQANG